MYYRIKRTAIKIIALLITTAFSIAASAQSADKSKGAYTDRAPYSGKDNVRGETQDKKIRISGMKSGRIIETKEKIIIDGAIFVGEGSDIQIKTETGERRQIIINNSQIYSDKATQSVVDLNTESSVRIRNTRIRARDSQINNNICAGILCIRAGQVETSDVQVNSIGNTKLTN